MITTSPTPIAPTCPPMQAGATHAPRQGGAKNAPRQVAPAYTTHPVEMCEPVSPATPLATVVAMVVHARGVPSAAREKFAEQCADLANHEGVVLIRTCHRVELYIALASFGDTKLPQLPQGGRLLEDAAAARHLISVACGLQSAVLGEDQVLHQVRETYVLRRAAHPLNPVLDRLFQVALNAGRRAHDWFAGSRRSLGDAALDEIERVVGDLADQAILVVGAGSMGRLTAHAARRRGARVIVTSRTAAHARHLASDVDGIAVAGANCTLTPVAGVVVALSGAWEIDAINATRLLESGATVVDLSSPPAVPEGVQAGLGKRFVSIDDLAWGPQVQLPDGLRDRLERLVSESGGEFCRWLRARASLPAIQAMTQAAEVRRQTELEWLARRIPNLSEQDRAHIDQMSHRLVAGILHAPKSALRLDESGNLGRAAWELFAL
jgi:glutamyl-tRNA reductase